MDGENSVYGKSRPPQHIACDNSSIGQRFLEHSMMRRVQPVMIGRHILAWLWLLLWLTAAPGAHARVVNSTDGAAVFTSSAGHEHHAVHGLDGLHFRSLRTSRRFDVQPLTVDPLAGDVFFSTGNFQRQDSFNSPSGSAASLRLASGWQFLLRTALSPRAPSFVS